MVLCLAAEAEETVLYNAKWGQGENGLDGWKLTPSGQVVADSKQGTCMAFGPGGAKSPVIPVKGGHSLRFRYSFRKTLPGMLYASVRQYAKGNQIAWRELQKFGEPFPDPKTVELGVLTEPEAEQIGFEFGLGGEASQRLTVSGFEVVDLGPPADIAVDGKELLDDPGWEARNPREALPAENSYGIGTWMGWGLPAVMVITNLPNRVHDGKRALMIRPTADTSQGHSGFRSNFSIPVKQDAWYDFSVWAKGEGTAQLHYVGDLGGAQVLLSPSEWRQLHLIYCVDNPVRKSFSVGVLVSGRVFIDDMSVRQITHAQATELRKTANQWIVPPKVAMTVPEGEKRSSENVLLENPHLRVTLSPLGGGHIVELEDKEHCAAWENVSLLNLVFPGQPVTIDWNIPFKTAKSADGCEVVFSHTVTGGAAAPFLDGVKIEQVFSLRPDDRLLKVTWSLTNASAGVRLPNPAAMNSWGADASVLRLAAEGETGSLFAETKPVTTANLVAGWMAASTGKASLVWGFDIRAVQEGALDPVKRQTSWSYLRLSLPPGGGAWQTYAWVASVPLSDVNYADDTAAVHAGLRKVGRQFELELGISQFAPGATDLRAVVKDYDNKELASAVLKKSSTVRFDPPAGRFITALEIGAGAGRRTAELFNDPRAREQKDAGIEGAGQTQYRPTVPIRVLRLPDAGDLRQTIAGSKTVLWAMGLFCQYYPLDAPLRKLGLEVESLDWANGFPEEIEELSAYRMVILSNLGAAHFSPLARAALSQYVRAGGSLLVIGGSMALGNSLTTGTDLEDLLPATLGGPFDVRPCAGQRMEPSGGSSFWQRLFGSADEPIPGLDPLPWGDKPRLYWRHSIMRRPTAVVLALADGYPVLLEWQCGLGKVTLFAGTVEGNPEGGEVAAWDWKGWPELWRLTLERLLRG